MKYHMIAFALGFFLDLLFGDPYWLPHPIRLIGKLIAGAEQKIRRFGKGKAGEGPINPAVELWQGAGLVFLVLASTGAVTVSLLFLAYGLHPYLGIAAEAVMTYQVLAAKCLKTESMKVYQALKEGSLQQARHAVSMIVGRDTECLNEEGVAKAAVETVAENTSDGVIAPMLYLAVGGPALGFFYKAVNTMDSMLGYVEEPYRHIGLVPAKLDDLFNFIPARLSALLMLAAGALLGMDVKNGWRIFRRDRYSHASPNSAQTESVCAGLLGLRLAGDASYHGQLHKKPFIGDPLRPIEHRDIPRACRLMYGTALLALAAVAAVLR